MKTVPRIKLLPSGRAPSLGRARRLSAPASLWRGTKSGEPVRTGPAEREDSGLLPRRVLIVGDSQSGRALAAELEFHFPGDYTVVGFVADAAPAEDSADGVVLGGREAIAELIRCHQIDEVIVAEFLSGRRGGVCQTPTASSAEGEAVTTDEWRDDETLAPQAETQASSRSHAALKRGSDILFSVTALALGAPVVLLAAAAIRMTSTGPIFYSQERIGCDGLPFTIFKLRTMIHEAESETGPTLASTQDPRSTPIGRILRATKLDEWPQFYNVLRGEMSVVGPRPERPCFVRLYEQHVQGYRLRHAVRPGITGLAQVRGGYRTHVYVKLRYDRLYIQTQSLWTDWSILLQTPLAILRNLRPRG